MENLSEKHEKMRRIYRKFFLESVSEIQSIIDDLKPQDFDGEIFESYPENSIGKLWQNSIINYLKTKLIPQLKEVVKEINLLRNKYSCKCCGVCCRLACSEFSYEELKIKADNDDNYARQFISIFVPYETLDDIKKIYPQYLTLLKDNNEDNFYFYYCPKVTEDNKCPDYENRPQICKDFPDNPIAFLPLSCGYNGWKLETEKQLLKVNATMAVVEFYISKIKNI